MAYNRHYSLQEVVETLHASEGRPCPGAPPGSSASGHAISMHTLERANKFARPDHGSKKARLPKQDSVFLVNRHSLATMVHEVLNSPSGQRELGKLNGSASKIEIRAVVLRQGEDFDVFTVYRPKDENQTSFNWLSSAKGDGFIVQLFVLVYKMPGSVDEVIHIQTVYPEHYARTKGDSIL